MLFYTVTQDTIDYCNTVPESSTGYATSRLQNDLDDFLSSDLELSFASTMSLNSPVGSPALSPMAMDISPAPAQQSQEHSGHLAPPRLFGRDLINSDQSPQGSIGYTDTKSKNKARQRAALPMQWMMKSLQPETLTVTALSDAMDVDEPSPRQPSPAPASAVANDNYSNLFFGESSPGNCPSPALKKRRSVSPPPEVNQSTSSSDPPSSPSHNKFVRAATIGAGSSLFKKPALEYNAPSTKRSPGRRPTFSALINPSALGQPLSAYPFLSGGIDPPPLSAPLPPPRRAFSAMVPPGKTVEPSSDDFSDMQSSSPAAAYAKRHQARVIRRCDGSEDLRPLHSAGSLGKRDRGQFIENKGCSPKRLAGFGVTEVEKKILPCHRVSDDGLVRITCDTLKALLDGAYSSRVSNFTVVDCRFDYEYAGGHIPGAVNLNTTTAVEDYFLGADKPVPCESGDPDARTVLVFHCEFSAKRAPTFAKHVRSKDRAINGRVYPKVCYPEMYILEGGYSQFYKQYSNHCEPRGYIQMDDPAYIHTRDADMDNFRRGKWLRTQSYTYGQTSTGISSFPSLQPTAAPAAPAAHREHRKTAPSGGPSGSGSMFAAATVARGRRTLTAKGLCTLEEDASSSGVEDGESLDLHDTSRTSKTPYVIA
ncbi:hypothetical protein BU17DRAFT_75192 [Hysterangium stoloniferum]|nr:hypothetical protein BU17DRAFT_75192 [Hysterangium stoloniferum]